MCNLFRSVLIRFPTLVTKTNFLVDRLHYRTHSCSGLLDPDMLAFCGALFKSAAQALNSRLAVLRPHVRFLRSENVVTVLIAQTLFLNLPAVFRVHTG